MRDFLFFAGMTLFLLGVVFIYWPAALVLLGLFLVYVALKMGEPGSEPAPSAS